MDIFIFDLIKPFANDNCQEREVHCTESGLVLGESGCSGPVGITEAKLEGRGGG